ncbi:MAG: hypothetical protein GC164_06005 [Phycisphaera sp.]|nr:hypothetical protein [Phycisphaera sp.]
MPKPHTKSLALSHRRSSAFICGYFLLCLVSAAHAQTTPVVQSRSMLLEPVKGKAIDQVIASAQSTDDFLRANAMEAAQWLPQRVTPIVQAALDDASPVVRFAALATIGRLELRDMKDRVVKERDDALAKVSALREQSQSAKLSDDERQAVEQQLSQMRSVYAAAIFAAKRCGAAIDITPLANLMAQPDPSLRSNVALLVGMINDPSAVPMLKELARLPMPRANTVQSALTRVQVAEALVNLGDEDSLDAVRAGAYSSLDEVRVMSILILGRLSDRQMEKGLVVILDKPPIEIQLAAATSLMRLGRDDGLKIMLEGSRSPIEAIRAQAAAGLGYFESPQAAKRLVEMLDDGSEQVRLSAAAGVLTALGPEKKVARPK